MVNNASYKAPPCVTVSILLLLPISLDRYFPPHFVLKHPQFIFSEGKWPNYTPIAHSGHFSYKVFNYYSLTDSSQTNNFQFKQMYSCLNIQI